MTITARGAAIFCGVILGGFGTLGLLVDPNGPWSDSFLLASWLPPIVLFPGAALAAVLGASPSDRFKDHTQVLWPTYAGLALYGLAAGYWSYYVAHIPALIAWVQTAAFLTVGGLLAPFPNTRPAGFQIWLGYAVLLACWVAGASLL